MNFQFPIIINYSAYEVSLLRACVDGDLELLCHLVSQGCDPNNVRDSNKETPLHYACRYVPLPQT